MVGAAEGYAGREVTFSIDMSQDLGVNGSLSLIAEPFDYPASIGSYAFAGGAYPILVSLDDGTNELVNVTGDCSTAGLYSCPSGSCSVNSGCTVSWPSAYTDRYHWEQHQLSSDGMGYTSTNIFPTCNWSGGSSAPDTPRCAFNSTFFSGGKLRTGTYTAKYAMMTSHFGSVPSSATAGLKLTVVKKKDANSGGAIDLNLIFVGNAIINDSRTDQGKVILDAVLAGVHDTLNQSGSGVKIGSVNSIEWNCEAGGDQYMELSSDNLGSMFAGAAGIIPAATDTKALNIFMIQQFSDSQGILGIAGGLGGPGISGLATSGVAVATFGDLDTLSAGTRDFVDLQLTIAHESGHYLGLNHVSERPGGSSSDNHDLLFDTPTCKYQSPTLGRISTDSCRSVSETSTHPVSGLRCNQVCTSYSSTSGTFCPTDEECSFNHLMWPFSKNFHSGTQSGDGNIVSPNSGTLINYHPYIQ
jgi:hypothetical protein